MPVYEYQGKHYELSDTDPTAAKQKILAHLGQTEQPKEDTSIGQKVDQISTKVFGKGPEKDMDVTQRIARVMESGVGGMAAGGVVGGGLGALAGGVGAVPGMAAGATLGGIGGVLGEIGEQISAELGGGRLTQVLTGLAAGAPAGEVGRALKAGGNITAEAIKGLIKPGRALGKIGDLLSPETSVATAELRRAEDLAARQRLAPESVKGAAAEVGTKVQEAVAQRQERAAALAARAEKGKLGETTALRQQQELADRELQTTIETGPGKTESPYNFGTKLTEEIQAVKDPLVKKASEEYGAAKTAAMETASKNESQGVFWAKEAGAQDIRTKWKNFAKNSSEDVRNSINKVIDDIWKKTPIKNEYGEIIGYKKGYLPSEGIDQIVRKLGDVGYGQETEGYKALGADIARQLREDITKGVEKDGTRAGGFYDWSGLGAAKGKYASALEDLERFKTARGEAATGAKVVDAEKLPKQLLGSESGLNEFKAMLPDPAKQAQFAQQYTNNELAGKDLAATRKWAAEHDFLMESYPQVKQSVQSHLNKLSSVENKSSILKERLAQAGEKTWSDSVDKFAKRWVAELGLEGPGGLPKDANLIVSDLLTSKFTGAQLKAVSKYLNDVPAVRARFPDAVAEFLADKPSSSIANTFRDIKPALEGSGLIDKASLARLEKGVDDIVKANRKVATGKKDNSKELKALFRSAFTAKSIAAGRAGAEAATGLMEDTEE